MVSSLLVWFHLFFPDGIGDVRMRGRKLPVEADELCLVAGVRVTMVEEITVPKYGQTLGRNGKLQARLYFIYL